MKTLSKVLSMLLVIVMCVGLFGTSAYALNDLAPIGGTSGGLQPITDSDDDDSTTGGYLSSPLTGGYETNVIDNGNIDTYGLEALDEEPGISLFSAGDMCCKVGNASYPDLQSAINNAKGKTITLIQDCELTDTITINENTVINLGGFELTLADNQILVNGKITASITNGTITGNNRGNDIVVSGGAKLTLSVEGEPTVYKDSSSTVNIPNTNLIAYIGTKGYETVQEAIDAATSGATIVVDSSAIADIEEDLTINKNLTFNLNDEKLSGSITISNANVTVSGYSFGGTVTLVNSKLNLGSTNADTVTADAGSSVTLKGGTISSLTVNGGTLNMSSGKVERLYPTDSATLNVSGGEAMLVGYSGGAHRTISGGTWTVENDSADTLEFLKNSVKDGLALKESNGKYIVGTGTNIDDDDDGTTTGKFTLYGSPYTKNSGKNVYFTESTGNQLGGLWIGTSNTNVSNVTNISNYISSYTSPVYIDNDYLDGLSNGTYYLFTYYTSDPNTTLRVGKLVINKSGIVIPGGELDVNLRYSSDYLWESGDGVLQFTVSPNSTGMTIYVDGNKVGNLDYWDYGGGYYALGEAYMEGLGSGTHVITAVDKDGNEGSCSFEVGIIFKPKDTTKHVIGSSETLKYICSEPISRVYVSGKLVDPYDDQTNYKLSSDGMTLTLTAAFLNDRTAGHTYTLSVDTVYGNSADSTFTILTTAQASSSPKTGDSSNLALWISALVMSGAAAAVVLPKMRKKENET